MEHGWSRKVLANCALHQVGDVGHRYASRIGINNDIGQILGFGAIGFRPLAPGRAGLWPDRGCRPTRRGSSRSFGKVAPASGMILPDANGTGSPARNRPLPLESSEISTGLMPVSLSCFIKDLTSCRSASVNNDLEARVMNLWVKLSIFWVMIRSSFPLLDCPRKHESRASRPCSFSSAGRPVEWCSI